MKKDYERLKPEHEMARSLARIGTVVEDVIPQLMLTSVINGK